MQWPKGINNDRQNTTQKVKDRATRPTLKSWIELRRSWKVSSGTRDFASMVWLIDYCLTSYELYLSYIQDENKFNIV